MSTPSLPPLTRQYPQWSRTGLLRFDSPSLKETELPRGRIKVKKSPPEVIASPQSAGSLEAVLRVSQLEQNIRFLQEQHALLLTGLHREIENLRQKNKDLQFQLVFSRRKSSLEELTASAASKDEDQTRISPTGDTSDKVHSTTSEDVVCKKADRSCCHQLEKELTRVKAALEASQSRAADIQAQLTEYKIKESEKQTEASHRIAESWSSNNAAADTRAITSTDGDGEALSPREAELKSRLTEAEKLVEGLRAQGERQRREVVEGGVTNLLFDTAPPVARNYLASIKASLNAAGRGNSSGNRNGGNGRGGNHQQRFPPLQNQAQAYWQQREESVEHLDKNSPVRKHGGLKSCFGAFGKLSRSCTKPTPSRDSLENHSDIPSIRKKIPPQNGSPVSVKSAVSKIDSTTNLSSSSTKCSCTEEKPTKKLDNSKKNNDYGCWTRGNQRRSMDKNDPSALPEVRGTNAIANYHNNGNNGNNSQGGGRGGSQGYCNQYFRNNDRIGGHRNSNQEDSYQRKNSNEDLSDSEVSSSQQTSSRGGHSYTNSRYKRGHHRHDNNS